MKKFMVGKNVWIEPDFKCEFGKNIIIEDDVYINFGSVIREITEADKTGYLEWIQNKFKKRDKTISF